MKYRIEGSTLIKEVEYYSETGKFTIWFTSNYYIDNITYLDFSDKALFDFMSAKSKGKHYLTFIKSHYKTLNSNIMADKIIKLKINVSRDVLNKDWLFVGEKGTYLNCTLLYNEEQDSYGNNGMIVQDVPKAVYEKEKKLPADKRTKGNILGNAKEFAKQAISDEAKVGVESGKMISDDTSLVDDLPF